MPERNDITANLPKLHYADISAAGQAQLLDMSFARMQYGIGAMALVIAPFIVWYFHLGNDIRPLLIWSTVYLSSVFCARWLYRIYRQQYEQLDDPTVVSRWTSRVQWVALLYGFNICALSIFTRRAPFEFHILYLGSVAAIVSAHATQSSPVLSIFRCFFLASWGTLILLVPYLFPMHWPYILPLTAIHLVTMLKHSAKSHRFLLEHIVLQEKTEKALYDKNLFLTTASHDLRQPVHAMGFLIEAIAHRNHDTALTPALDDLRRSVQSVTLMFNSLLDLSKIESGNVDVQSKPIALNPLMRDVIAMFRDEAKSRGLRLHARMSRHGKAVVLGDDLLLRQSLTNLVHNALRYTVSGGVLIGARRRGEYWRLEVWDTGIGIAVTEKSRIYSPFYRNDNAWKIDSAGHGLGLAVVARCADLMQATYGFDSIEKRGSRFWLQLPATAPITTGVLPHPRFTKPTNTAALQGKVLVVDDDPQVISAWRSLMTAWGVDVRCAGSAAEAFAVVDAGFTPQVILCDQCLRSGDSGFVVLKTLFARCPDASGAMVSGEFSLPELKDAEAEGYLVLRKPLDVEQLRLLLEQWLTSRS